MKLLVFAYGRLKTPGLRDTSEYYEKLLRPWVSLEVIELKPLAVPDKSASTRKQIQEKESALLLEKISSRVGPRGHFYLLDEGGKALMTSQWAGFVRDWEGSSASEVAFCIGSSLGFSDEIRKKARSLLSLGPQTLSHDLARAVLLEQLYRAWSVVRGHPYHNEGS